MKAAWFKSNKEQLGQKDTFIDKFKKYNGFEDQFDETLGDLKDDANGDKDLFKDSIFFKDQDDILDILEDDREGLIHGK